MPRRNYYYTFNDKIKNIVDRIHIMSDLWKFNEHQHVKEEEYIFLKELIHKVIIYRVINKFSIEK